MQENGVGELSSSTSIDHMLPPPAAAADTRGKHRISAEVKRLEQEARFLEEELEEVERTEKASAALQELLHKVDSRPDPLLPLTNGPAIPSWDRWFEGPHDLHGCKCWIL